MLEFPKNSLLRSKTSQRESGWNQPTKRGWLLLHKVESVYSTGVARASFTSELKSAAPKSKLPQCEIFQEPIQSHFGATPGAIDSYQSRQVNHIANLEELRIFRFQLDHLAARTDHLISSDADRVDDSFSWHG